MAVERRSIARVSRPVLLTVALIAAVTTIGCGGRTPLGARSGECGGADCHEDIVERAQGGPHSSARCTTCHDGPSDAHYKDPIASAMGIDWTIDGCAECHADQAGTYLYDDNAQIGPFGGSRTEPPQPKTDPFPLYNTIIGGHAFTRDYNEEGAHATGLAAHYETKRGKFETCMQCKSTKIAYYWNSGKPIITEKDHTVTLTHTATGTTPAKQLSIPKGTKLTLRTDTTSRLVDARAVFPDGRTFTSRPKPSDDATANFNTLWAATIAASGDIMPYGASCNHCHDPHSAAPRILRKAMLDAMNGKDSGERAGANPYDEDSSHSYEGASRKDKRVLMCAQCHVEYTCGKSGVDANDRDAFGWAKARDLHELYTRMFDYRMDWKHSAFGEPLIKSQHPETELFWNSVHYNAGVTCRDCHMPEVTKRGRTFRSHWMTSPYKYSDAKAWTAFATANGIDRTSPSRPCELCHADRTQEGIALQRSVYARQKPVEALLAESVGGLARMKAWGMTSKTPEFAEALENHRQAHVLWENLIVSENSMGFHNPQEVMASMDEAEAYARKAIAIQRTPSR